MQTNERGSFAGKVAFVTGVADGIGRAAELAFAREGASVVVADISEQGDQETARLIEGLGGRALAVTCDVTRAEDVKAALDRSRSRRSAALTPPSTTQASSSRSRRLPISRSRSGTGSSRSPSAASSCA